MSVNKLCPCGSGHEYLICCKKYHSGAEAENALALMRSRYAAYAMNEPLYIIHTTHPRNPKHQTDVEGWEKNITEFCLNTFFERLEILEFQDGEDEAFVTFTAHLKQGKSNATFTEKSRFNKLDGRWLYLDGIITSHEHR